MRRTIFMGIALCMLLVLAGCGETLPSPTSNIYFTNAEINTEPLPIKVFAGDMEIEWVVGLNKWNGAIFDRLDNFQWIMSHTTFEDLPIISNGETISIQFIGDVPDEYALTEFILTSTGDVRFNVPGMEYEIEFDDNGFGSFTVKPNIATGLSSYSGDYEPGNTIKGYRLVVRWGENECEYAFIIRGDAITQMNTSLNAPPQPQSDSSYEAGRVSRELEGIPGQSPSLHINISADGIEEQNIRAAQGTTSWSWYSASGDHPLDFWKETWECIDFSAFKASLHGADSEIVIRFNFDFPPTAIQVKRWSTAYIGMTSEMWNDYEPVEVTDNIVHINNDGKDYIYMVVGSWAHGEYFVGRAVYTFRLNAGRYQKVKSLFD